MGFTNAGFKLTFANDNDRDTWKTFEENHNIPIDKRSIIKIEPDEIPDADGIIGGPPCQSWSLAGVMRGIMDERGKLFYEYIRTLKEKSPRFFLAENVPGMISSTHKPEFKKLLAKISALGYKVKYGLVNANDYGVPQERRRVIIVGYDDSVGDQFEFPKPQEPEPTLQDAIKELPESVPAKDKNKPNKNLCIPNHEHMNGGFSTLYMSRNRKRNWNEPSFTIQAGGRHAPLHPNSASMKKLAGDRWEFVGKSPVFRRHSVRECARIQTFPDDFVFHYDNVAKGYKLIGNAVPVKLAEAMATQIKSDLK